MKPKNRKKVHRDRPTLPELDQTKKSVLNGLTSLQSRRSYQHAIDEFIGWYCSEPRLALNRAVVLRYLSRDSTHCVPHHRASDKRCRFFSGRHGHRTQEMLPHDAAIDFSGEESISRPSVF
jgi:hypothetical protein